MGLENIELCEISINSRATIDDPSVLNHKLRRACAHLGTVHHEQADSIVGTLVAVNAPRMAATVWPVLFHSLRSHTDAKVKVSLLRHFGNVCGRVPVSQRCNAFRIFAKESEQLFSDMEIVVNDSFRKSFSLILEALGLYGEREWCTQIFEVILGKLRDWEKMEAVRACSYLAAVCIVLTTECGRFESFLKYARENFSLQKFITVLENCSIQVLNEIKKNNLSVHKSPSLQTVKEYVETIMSDVFMTENLNTKIISPVISCFAKIKAGDISWELANERFICTAIFNLIEHEGTKKVLILPPLLLFLQKTSINWWNQSSVVHGILKTTRDPLIKAGCYISIANMVDFVEDDNDLVNLIPDLLNEFRSIVLESHCPYALGGMLELMKAIIYRLHSAKKPCPLFTEFIYLFSNILMQRNIESVQLLALSIVKISPRETLEIIAPYLFRFCLWSEYATVRKMAIELLLFNSCFYSTIMDEIYGCNDIIHKDNYFEVPFLKAFYEPFEEDLFFKKQLVSDMVNYFSEKLLSLSVDLSGQKNWSELEACCEAIEYLFIYSYQHFCEEVSERVFSHSFSKIVAMIYSSIIRTESTSLGVVVRLLNLGAVCGRHCSASSLPVFLHKRVLSLTWNMIHLCCSAIDPDNTPPLGFEECLYFSESKVSIGLINRIQTAAESALSNNERLENTEFFSFVEATLDFFAQLIWHGSELSVFIEQLSYTGYNVVSCLDILAGICPNNALSSAHILIKAIFSFHRARDILIMDEFCSILGGCRKLINRCFALEMSVVGTVLFGFLEYIVLCDTSLATLRCYESIDGDSSLVLKAIYILLNPIYFRSCESVIEPAMGFLAALLASLHREALMLLLPAEFVETVNDRLEQSSLLFGKRLGNYENLTRFFQTCQSENRSITPDLIEAPPRTAEEFFLTFEVFGELYQTKREEIQNLYNSGKYTLSPWFLLCLASVDESFITRAVECFLKTHDCPSYLVEVMTLVLIEANNNNNNKNWPTLDLSESKEFYTDSQWELYRVYKGKYIDEDDGRSTHRIAHVSSQENICEVLDPIKGVSLFNTLVENEAFHKMNSISIVSFAQSFARDVASCTVKMKRSTGYLEHATSLLMASPYDMVLRHSILLTVAVMYHANGERDDVLYNADCFLKEASLLKNIIELCTKLELPGHNNTTVLVEAIMNLPSSKDYLLESILWLSIQMYKRVIIESTIQDAAFDDEMKLDLLCLVGQVVGFPSSSWAGVISFIVKVASAREEADDVGQHEKWELTLQLCVSLLLNMAPLENPDMATCLLDMEDIVRHDDAFHSIFTQSTQTLLAMRRATPAYAHQRGHWNYHRVGSFFPSAFSLVTQTLRPSPWESVLQLLVAMIDGVLATKRRTATFLVPTALFALRIVSTCTAALRDLPDASRTVYHATVQVWLSSILMPFSEDDSGDQKVRIMQNHTLGLFPAPTGSLDLLDTASISAAIDILGTLAAMERPVVDMCRILPTIMRADHGLYVSGLTAIATLCRSASREHGAALSTIFLQRLCEDLQSSEWCYLSSPFLVKQQLRCACALVKVIPDEKLTSKVFESIWSTVLPRPEYAALGHYLVQCVLHATPTTCFQWNILQLMILGSWEEEQQQGDNGQKNAWSSGYQFDAVFGIAPHQSPLRRVPLSSCQDDYSQGLEPLMPEHSWTVRTVTKRLLLEHQFLTQATLLLCSGAPEVSIESTEMATISLLTHTASRTVTTLLALEVLSDNTVNQRDALVTAVNHFDFSVGARRTLIHSFIRVLDAFYWQKSPSERRTQLRTINAYVELFFELSLRRVKEEEHPWWLLLSALAIVGCAQDRNAGMSFCARILMPSSLHVTKALLQYISKLVLTSPLRDGGIQLLTRLHGIATASPSGGAVLVQPILALMESYK